MSAYEIVPTSPLAVHTPPRRRSNTTGDDALSSRASGAIGLGRRTARAAEARRLRPTAASLPAGCVREEPLLPHAVASAATAAVAAVATRVSQWRPKKARIERACTVRAGRRIGNASRPKGC